MCIINTYVCQKGLLTMDYDSIVSISNLLFIINLTYASMVYSLLGARSASPSRKDHVHNAFLSEISRK